MTGKEIIKYIQEHHYEDCEMLAKLDASTNQMLITFAPPEEDEKNKE